MDTRKNTGKINRHQRIEETSEEVVKSTASEFVKNLAREGADKLLADPAARMLDWEHEIVFKKTGAKWGCVIHSRTNAPPAVLHALNAAERLLVENAALKSEIKRLNEQNQAQMEMNKDGPNPTPT